MRVFCFKLTVVANMFLLASCSISAAPPGYAECPICKENGDLACLYVKPSDKTPHLKIDNVDYFFCSQECKESFVRRLAVSE